MLDLDELEALYSTMSHNIEWSKWSAAHSNACAIADAAPFLIGELRALRVEIAQIKSMRLCQQCAMAASFMAGGGGDGGVA